MCQVRSAFFAQFSEKKQNGSNNKDCLLISLYVQFVMRYSYVISKREKNNQSKISNIDFAIASVILQRRSNIYYLS